MSNELLILKTKEKLILTTYKIWEDSDMIMAIHSRSHYFLKRR